MNIILYCRKYAQCVCEGKIYFPLSLFRICVFEIGYRISETGKTEIIEVVVVISENNYCNRILLFLITT